jgi:predicted  nucleic acid-binding Zn-ribbon protein
LWRGFSDRDRDVGSAIGYTGEYIVKTQVELLVKLQEKDQAIDQLAWQMREGPERLKVLEGQLQELEEAVEDDKNRVQELKQAQRQYEGDIEDGVAHIRKSRGRLMSIKNNREYKALLREIEDTEKENSKREDKVLECLEEIEGLKQGFELKENELLKLQDELETERKAVGEEVARVQEELTDVEKGRDGLMQTIDPNLLGKYKQIKKMSGGIAVSLVNHATCGACHLGIPPQMYNELQRQDTLQFCPHCQRIIYWKETEPAS